MVKSILFRSCAAMLAGLSSFASDAMAQSHTGGMEKPVPVLFRDLKQLIGCGRSGVILPEDGCIPTVDGFQSVFVSSKGGRLHTFAVIAKVDDGRGDRPGAKTMAGMVRLVRYLVPNWRDGEHWILRAMDYANNNPVSCPKVAKVKGISVIAQPFVPSGIMGIFVYLTVTKE